MKKQTYPLYHFVADRLIYILLFLACSVCIVTVAVLGIVPAGTSDNSSSVAYLFLLTICFAAAALLFDYFRQAAFYRSAQELLESDSIDAMALLKPGVTREQKLLIRAMELQYGKYKDLLKQYRDAEERRRHFTNRWVHQIKTPVSVIDLLTQESSQPPGSQPIAELLHSIREENGRISDYLELVLHEARLEQFENDVRAARVDLFPLLRTAVNRYKTTLIQAHIYPSLTGDQAEVVTDEKWLAFVINQLLSNAIKYSRSKEGSKQLRIHIARQTGETLLSITDQGIGIPEQDLPRVTEPFFTGENGRRTRESTGIGLYLVYEVCRKLGHQLQIQSQEGQGTTVTIRFTERSVHHLSGSEKLGDKIVSLEVANAR